MYEPDMKLKKRELYLKLDLERGEDSTVKKIYELLFTQFHLECYQFEMKEDAIRQLIQWLLEDIIDRHLYCEKVKIAYLTGSKFYQNSFQKAVCLNLINSTKEGSMEALCSTILPFLNELLWVREDVKREETFLLLNQCSNQVRKSNNQLEKTMVEKIKEQPVQKRKLYFLKNMGEKDDNNKK